MSIQNLVKEATETPVRPTTPPALTLRDHLAMAALTGIIANPGFAKGNEQMSAKRAYQYADAMMAERSK